MTYRRVPSQKSPVINQYSTAILSK